MGYLRPGPKDPVVKISGRVYKSRPPAAGISSDRSRRLASIVDSLSFAASSCVEPERRLYKEILQVLAHAENLMDQQAREVLPDPSLIETQSGPGEP
jgi:hypothetical protein